MVCFFDGSPAGLGLILFHRFLIFLLRLVRLRSIARYNDLLLRDRWFEVMNWTAIGIQVFVLQVFNELLPMLNRGHRAIAQIRIDLFHRCHLHARPGILQQAHLLYVQNFRIRTIYNIVLRILLGTEIGHGRRPWTLRRNRRLLLIRCLYLHISILIIVFVPTVLRINQITTIGFLRL